MNFDPEFVSIMVHKFTKKDVLDIHKSLKQYSKKVSRKHDLIKELTYLIYSYEILYNRLQKEINPTAQDLVINKDKLHSMTQDELIGMHTMFRRCLKYTNTKQGAIQNILAFVKQMHYFVTY